jgi:predicted O-methyltransferase YrrM
MRTVVRQISLTLLGLEAVVNCNQVAGKPNGFISHEEFAHFTRVAQSADPKAGLIVDAGCFVGASTLALCQGLSVDCLTHGAASVVAIDRFVATDNYLVENFSAQGIDVRYGESFLSVFLQNVCEYVPYIDVRAGDLVRVGRINGPISILVIDIAKSPGLNGYVIVNWFSRLIPECSIVIHQDFYAPSHLWIAATMGTLLDYFELINEKVGESATFRLTKAIPQEALQAAAQMNPVSDAGLAALDKMIQRITPAEQPPLLIMRALVLFRVGRSLEAKQQLEAVASRPIWPRDEKWRQWLGMAMASVDPDIFARERATADVYLSDARARMGF